ncbi:TPR-like protein [Polyplosphaeria fusca]|uniref:TPR-like protein n=1 Tax=Polyplosphaeria fusca TaxID=682080 RepID=A0A9P4QXA9_9PLEO|nr:TPR-like protein [Polyplosphaeria fusca]
MALRSAIYNSLDNGFVENALFLCGLLQPEDVHLKAHCMLQAGQYKAAYDAAKRHTNLGCVYVFARACLGLERFSEGAHALEKARIYWEGRGQKQIESRRFIPDSSACYTLLGKLWAGHGDSKRAMESYIEALKLNPLLWDAFTGLCHLGAFVRPVNIFKLTPMLASMSQPATFNGDTFLDISEAKDPFVSTPEPESHDHGYAPSLGPTAAPPRRSVRLLGSRIAAATSTNFEERRELRKAKATGTKGTNRSLSTVGRVVSGNRKPPVEISEDSKPDLRPSSTAVSGLPAPKMAPLNDSARAQDSIQRILDLLVKMGTGYAHLSRFQCVQALDAFAAIPAQYRETPWVLSQIGKAYYELSRWSEAEKVFQRIREKAPSRMEDMEVFSNVLWQLKKETDLAHLAHTLVEQDRLSPQAWCALGNAFSLQREHDQAIKCFTRATQLDPKFAYAFTLQGHEHVANEDYDKALYAYRCAISADNRHYNGWYGLGQVFEKMGKYDVAEKHYRAASQINPTNALLAVKIGLVLDRMKKTQPALIQYVQAVALDPRSNLARFRKAQIHLKLNQPQEALRELEVLKDAAPDDANVHFMLGRTHKKMGQRANAIKHFTIALNLDPKASQYIKEAMESIGEDEDDGGYSSEGSRA